jgi:hypothetical protein
MTPETGVITTCGFTNRMNRVRIRGNTVTPRSHEKLQVASPVIAMVSA